MFLNDIYYVQKFSTQENNTEITFVFFGCFHGASGDIVKALNLYCQLLVKGLDSVEYERTILNK
jgi:hypothetical protein